MSPEERELLEKSVNLAEENHKMLRYMKRSMRIAHIMSIIYWVIIIGSAIGAYYFLQPYIDKAISIYGSAQTNLDNVGKMIGGFKR